MSTTIRVRVSPYGEGGVEGIRNFFLSQGMAFASGFEEEKIFFIELKHRPDVLTRLEAAGYFLEDEVEELDMMGITNQGVTLYYCGVGGDGYIFIPQNNIRAIHTLDQNFLDSLASNGRSGRRKKKEF